MKHRRLAALLLCSLSGAVAPAQQAPASDPEPPEGELVELSPFVVTAATDRGYVATNTEAGSRLNSRILDTPSAISIMTTDFLQDIDAISIDDALNFGLNTESEPETDGEGYRIRGIRSGSYSRNYFIRGSGDTYNISRATFSRGPNSILFGNADPSGIINITTKQPDLSRNRLELSSRIDDEGGWRVTGGLSHVIVPKRVAIRVDALNQELDGYRDPTRDDWKAYYVAGTAMLVDKRNYQLTVRFDYEQVRRMYSYARKDVITESVSYWKSQGGITAPYGNGVTGSSTTPAGATRQGSTNYLVVVDQSLTPIPILNWKNTARGAEDPGGILPASGELWPIYVNSMGLSAGLQDDRQRFRTVYIEQKIGKNFFLQAAYNDYDRQFWRPWSNEGFTELRVDINEQLPSLDGARNVDAPPNPNVGQYYFEKVMRPQDYRYDESTFRVSAAYELDLRPINTWLGYHRLVGSYDRREVENYIDNYIEVNLTPLAGYPAALNENANRIYRRSYVYRDKGIYSVSENLAPIQQGAGGINSGYVRAGTVPTATRTKSDSLFGALQSFWLKNRLVTIAGIRRDHVKNWDRDLLLGPDPDTGVWDAASSAMLSPEPANDDVVNTSSLGAVFHLTKWLSIFYNKSDNFSPGSTRRDINGAMIPISVGKGQDAGIKFQLFDNKLSGTIGAYKNTKEHDTVTGILAANDAVSDINSIWGILNEPDNSSRRPGGGYGSPRNTRDYEAQGFELDLTYNPLRNWRISLSAAYNDTTYQRVVPALDTYIEKYIDVWRSHGTESGGGSTVNEIIDNRLLPNHRELKSMEGDTAAFIRPLSITLVTSYRFTNPRWLRGVSVGGSVRYRDRTIIGFGENGDGTINRDVTYHGRDIYQTNAFIAYERNFFRKKVRWKTQLSVRNVLDDTDPLEVRARPDGVPDRLQLVQPRTLTWSNSFSF
ncbi:hypothetical protein OH491_10225 [Termitidicoccus mucosus]|uniref:TonB-dependent receptor plug domain-containing protein n=1 Tax=Termitidicoccus mucosus TaxID=1184151 RepID=A0A178IG33_9BACT|nr:hypothetical protein AW736_17115 [Opitutaceae bacterium TSB47]